MGMSDETVLTEKVIAAGWNPYVWRWLESLGIDYGKERGIRVEIGVKGDIQILATHVGLMKDGTATERYTVVARGKNKTPEFWEWVDTLGFRSCRSQHVSIDFNASEVVRVHPTLIVERIPFERMPEMLSSVSAITDEKQEDK
jgi:hypothetical protein